jgi:hypothetical protein
MASYRARLGVQVGEHVASLHGKDEGEIGLVLATVGQGCSGGSNCVGKRLNLDRETLYLGGGRAGVPRELEQGPGEFPY